MTGAELLARVRDTLRYAARHGGYSAHTEDEALAALAGCVLLTGDEAEKVRAVVGAVDKALWATSWKGRLDEALVLLTPAGKDEA